MIRSGQSLLDGYAQVVPLMVHSGDCYIYMYVCPGYLRSLVSRTFMQCTGLFALWYVPERVALRSVLRRTN